MTIENILKSTTNKMIDISISTGKLTLNSTKYIANRIVNHKKIKPKIETTLDTSKYLIQDGITIGTLTAITAATIAIAPPIAAPIIIASTLADIGNNLFKYFL